MLGKELTDLSVHARILKAAQGVTLEQHHLHCTHA